MSVVTDRPEIWRYQDYRRFLADFYQHKKTLRSGFSYRLFASRCGIKSPNYLQLVIQGKRNLSPSLAAAVSRGMGLSAAEGRFFCALVKGMSADNDEAREQARREGLIAMKQALAKTIPSDQKAVVSSWRHLLVRELAFLSDFEFSPQWVCRRLNGILSLSEAEESLNLLVRCGMLVRDSSGRWLAKDAILDTGPEGFDELRVVEMHRQLLRLWAERLPKMNPQDREMGVLNIPIRASRVGELQQRLRQFQDELIGWLQGETQADQVVQLGIYLVPMTNVADDARNPKSDS